MLFIINSLAFSPLFFRIFSLAFLCIQARQKQPKVGSTVQVCASCEVGRNRLGFSLVREIGALAGCNYRSYFIYI